MGLSLQIAPVPGRSVKGKVMKRDQKLLWAAVFVAVPTLATVASAANLKGEFSVSPLVGGISFTGGQNLETSPVFGVRGGYNVTREVGLEMLLDYAETREKATGASVKMYRYGGDLLYHFLPESRFVPYLAAGLSGISMDGNPATGGSTQTMAATGYGVGAKYAVTDDIQWRWDLRHLLYHSGSSRQAVEYTMGISIPFGRPAQPAKLAEPSPVPGAPGLYVHVYEGTITLTNQAGRKDVGVGQFGYSASYFQMPVILQGNPGLPPFTPPPDFPMPEGVGQPGAIMMPDVVAPAN